MDKNVVYTVRDVASILRVSGKTVYALIRDQELPCIWVRGQIRITSEQLNKYMEGGENMEKELRGTLYKKNEHYYARVYYYVEGKRKSKDYKTGIEAGSPSTRKGKQNERLANQKLAELLANFRIPGVINVEDLKEQMLTETLTNWLEYQKGARSASTIAGYQWAANDLLLYFGEIAPVRTVDLTSEMVERYQNWERMRRSPGYKGEHKKKTMYSDGSGIENTVKHRTTMLRSVLQYAKRAGMVDRNVASNRDSYVDFPNPQRHEFQVLTPEEAQKMLECLEHEE